jgi:hypothetical protein
MQAKAWKTMQETIMKCLLEGCNKKAKRKFCSNKHKDRYHNIRNARGFYAYLNYVEDELGWDAHKETF